MKEEFLYYLWEYRLLVHPLHTTDGETIEVIRPGTRNTDAGPDFIDARIRIGTTIWAGNVEIHMQASAWFDHKHEKDPAYSNVILHVVLNSDRPVCRPDGQFIPCLECSNLIPDSLYEKYKALMNSRLWIPCARILKFCSKIIISSTIEAQIVERLLNKTKAFEKMLENLNNDWEEVHYQLIVRSFGLKANALPFEMLATSLPQKILMRHRDQATQVEALIFGQAGFLSDRLRDPYPLQLKSEYEFLRNKYSLQPLDKSVWKFLRLRPAGFPTIRLAQLAALMQQSTSLFSAILDTDHIRALRSLFRVKPNEYWDSHFRFDVKSSCTKPKFLSEQCIDLLIINAVIPLLFLYASQHQMDKYKMKGLGFLEKLPPEKNSVMQQWEACGMEVNNALTSQALINLKNQYCDRKRCLDCRIGNELLK